MTEKNLHPQVLHRTKRSARVVVARLQPPHVHVRVQIPLIYRYIDTILHNMSRDKHRPKQLPTLWCTIMQNAIRLSQTLFQISFRISGISANSMGV